MFGSGFRRILRAAGYSLLVVSVHAQTAQTQKDALLKDPPQDAIKLKAELVVVDAQVIDKRNHELIRGLKSQDLELFEDDARQRIEFLPGQAAALDRLAGGHQPQREARDREGPRGRFAGFAALEAGG